MGAFDKIKQSATRGWDSASNFYHTNITPLVDRVQEGANKVSEYASNKALMGAVSGIAEAIDPEGGAQAVQRIAGVAADMGGAVKDIREMGGAIGGSVTRALEGAKRKVAETGRSMAQAYEGAKADVERIGGSMAQAYQGAKADVQKVRGSVAQAYEGAKADVRRAGGAIGGSVTEALEGAKGKSGLEAAKALVTGAKKMTSASADAISEFKRKYQGGALGVTYNVGETKGSVAPEEPESSISGLSKTPTTIATTTGPSHAETTTHTGTERAAVVTRADTSGTQTEMKPGETVVVKK